MAPDSSQNTDRKVFVTVGTTNFDPLIKAVLRPSVVSLLQSQGYTTLRVQYGQAAELYQACYTADLESTLAKSSMLIGGYAYASGDEITQEIKTAELVICHAGSGTILECLRYQKRIVTIPNESLMDNHQVELANEMARQKYVIKGDLSDLIPAITQSLTFKYKHFPRQGSKIFSEVMEEELDQADKDKIVPAYHSRRRKDYDEWIENKNWCGCRIV
ncbi:N-acetylglucosaminyldiphosphodolichol N-acetylglucosaminyltransferase catalytic subunit alg13 [Orbilia ellipsospora]|uniref:UDP-N-acetylglucosamine transferase subunit ALG13 n=1 Tax=Orbilia ellipsospora TaxID=2528407 RepID=A0AAV9WZJ7_9PEZI